MFPEDDSYYLAVIAVETTRRFARKPLREIYNELSATQSVKRVEYVAQLLREAGVAPDDSDAASWVRKQLNIFRSRAEISQRYAPTVYPGRIDLFVSEGTDDFGIPMQHLMYDMRTEWARWAKGGLRLHVVPGLHDTMLTEPWVGTLAGELGGAIRTATAATSAL
jgi:thioesterase domain-containing protein